MDAIVTARVPIAVKERGSEILGEIGATTTQLVNAAYDYLLAEHDLPRASSDVHGFASKGCMLSEDQVLNVKGALARMFVGPEEGEGSFDERLAQARDERFADFA